ncbi:MAG: MarP family serine protease [Thermoleophilaceae bacterium]
MTALDWIILGFAALMAVWGYAQGLIVGALSLAGFAAGGFLGSRIGPLFLAEGSRSPYAPLFALLSAVFFGGLLASTLEIVGFHLRERIGDRLGALDGLGGAVLVACLGLGLVWIAGTVALQTPGARELRRPIQRSTILSALNERLPPSGPLLKALARFDPFPKVQGPRPGVGPPDSAIARDPQVRAAARSVVKVLGTACGLGVEGSGWVAARGVVVTNAHVVAGQDDTTVELQGQGSKLDAQAVWFDPHDDVAVLRVPGAAGAPALALNQASRPGTSAAVLGFPGNGPYDVRPARVGVTAIALTDDAYGRGPVRRKITALRALVRPGNSGGPVVDGAGRVVATVFAATVSESVNSGFGVPDTIVRGALSRARAPVDTGPCAR